MLTTMRQASFFFARLWIVLMLAIAPLFSQSAEPVQALSFNAQINVSFSPTVMYAGDVTRMKIEIFNPNAFILENTSFKNDLEGRQPGLRLADPVNVVSTCGGTLIASPGGTIVQLSGGEVPARAGTTNGYCVIELDVTANRTGNLINSIPAYAAPMYGGLGLHAVGRGGLDEITNINTADATILIRTVASPVMSKIFNPSTVWVGQPSQLTINIQNTEEVATGVALTGATFIDTLPSPFVVANPSGASLVGCTAGSIAATPGGTTVGLTGGVIPPGATCSVRVNVLSTTQAEYVNTIPAGPVAPGSLQTNQGVTNTSPISAPINVQAVGIVKSFIPGTFVETETTTLQITLRNPTGVDYTNVNLVDNLPAGLEVTSFNANQCGGTVAYLALDNRLTLTGGTIPAGSVTTPGFCVIQAQVTSNSPGVHTNTIGSGDLTGDGLTNVFPASANVTVLPRTIEVAKSFSPGFIGAGEIATLTVVLRNRTSQAFTNVSFVDQFTLPTTLEIVDPPAALASFNASPSCGPGATLTKISSTSFGLTGAIVPAGTPTVPGTCTVSVQVTSNAAGTFFNQIPANTVSSGEGVGNASPSNNAGMTVYLGGNADLSKTFSPSTLLAGNPATLTLTIRSPHDTSLSGIAFSDTLPDGMIILASPAPTNSCGGSLLAEPGTRLIRLTDGAIPTRNATCTIQVPVTVTGSGEFTNTIPAGALTSFEGRTDPAPTTATLQASSLQIGKNFSPDTISPNGHSRLTIALSNTNTVPLVNLSVTDDLTTMNLFGDDPTPGVDGVYIASPANVLSTCGGSFTATPDSQTFQLSNGIIPASDGLVPGLCTVSFDVQGRGIDATRINTITTNNVSATIFGTATTINPVGGASDSLTITPLQIQIVKEFHPVSVFGGSYSTLTITLVNPSDSASLSGIAFSDTMPAGMLMATPVNFNVGTCGGMLERDTVDPDRTFHFSGGSLLPSDDCSMTLRATMDVIGNRTNIIPVGEVTTLEGATNPDGTEASLTNLPGANLTKEFAPNPVPAGDISFLTIRISNTSNVALTGMGMNDLLPGSLPAGLEIAPAPAATNSCGGTLTATPGAQTIQLSNGVLANGAICEIVVPVLSSVPGSYTNTIPAGGLSNEQGWINKEPAEDTLEVTAFSLGNRVWEDVNNNGLRDGGETGIGSLTVNLYEDSDSDGVPDGPPIATMLTDSSGYYRFDDLAADTYLVGVMPPAGYASSAINATGPGIDDDDDGITLTGTGEVLSGLVTLGPSANEPVGETDSPTGATPGLGEAPDNQSNRTVDFGFFRTYSLGNRVWLDDGAGTGGVANDGIRQDGELGITGVRVNLYNQSGTLINFTWTDANGYYRFDNLVAGDYVVEVVTPAGYANTAITGGDPDSDTADNDNNGAFDTGLLVRSHPVTLGPGSSEPEDDTDSPTGATSGAGEAPNNQSNRTVDFGFVRGYSLGNRVWLDNGAGGGTANDGIRDSGEPGINGVTVNLYRFGYGPDGIAGNADDNAIVATTITADGGYYRFDGLMPGDYVVEIAPPSGYNNTSITGIDPNTDTDDNDNNGAVVSGSNLRSNPVTLGPGASEPTNDNDPVANPQTGEAPNDYSNRTVDFGLYYQPYSLGNRVWADDGGGVPANADNGIRDAGEAGLAGVPVYLYRDSNSDGNPDGGPIAFTTTDSQGYYRFDDLQAGTYLVRVTAPDGYYSSSIDAANPGVDDNVDNGIGTGTGFVWSSPVVLGPGAVEPTGESDPATNPLPGEAPDAYSNRTVDFGFAPLASIGDRVWNDVNQNGIQDAVETGVVGVTVTLYSSTDVQIAQTTTNGGGYYFFPDLYPGDYYVVVTPLAGYLISPQDQGGNDALDSDIDATGRTITTTLTPGENDLTWDAGIYQPPASIGNYVWNDDPDNNNTDPTDRNGIQDAGELGINGVTVYLYRPGYGADGIPDTADDDQPVASTLTANDGTNDGAYLFEDLTPGDYYVSFVPPAGYAISPMNQGGDDELDSDADPLTYQTALTTLSPDEDDLSWDAGMYLAPASLGNRVWEDLNGNGLQDGGEPGVANVTVNLYRPGYGPDGIPGNVDDDAIVATDTTDSSGEYGFTGLTPGQYYVEFIRPAGYVITFIDQGANDAIDSDADPSTGQTALITLVADQNDPDWDMGILQTVSLGDYVWSDLNRDGIQDPDGLDNTPGNADDEVGINGVRVDLYTAAGDWVATTTTANDGSNDGAYLFNNLRPGEYYVVFTPPTGWGFSPQDQGGNDTLDSDVNPTSGQTAVFSLTSGNDDLTRDAGLFQFASLGNYVWHDQDEDGVQDVSEDGVNGVTVNLYDSANNLVRTTVTANDGLNDGAYLFEDLVPGDYYVEFVLPTGYVFTIQNSASATPATDSDAKPDAPNQGRTATTTLDPGENDLSWDAGIYQPKASLGDFVWEDLNGDGIQDPDGLDDILGTPDDEVGINGVTVELYNQAGVLVATTVTANDGVNDGIYGFTDLEPGYYYVKFIAPDGYIVTLSDQGGNDTLDSDALVPNLVTIFTELTPGENDPTWDAGFARPVAIGNRVWYDTGAGTDFNNGRFDSGESGVPNLRVDLYTAADNSLLASTLTDSNGRYYFSNLRPGQYYVLIPSGQFGSGGPLAGYTSSTGSGVSASDDHNVDENGIDDLDFLTNGIRSQVYTLVSGSMPTGEDQTGYSGTLPAPGDDDSINATVDFGFVPAIAFSKVLTTTEVSEAGNDHTQAVIGEWVTYTLTATFGQASTPGVVITDVLDDGLAFMQVVSITPGANLTSTVGPIAGVTPTVTNSGRNLSFDFGTVTNASPTNAPESIVIVYRAVVLNVAGNQSGTTLNNAAQMAWSGPRSPLSAAADEVTVVEPNLTITKSPNVTSGLDAGDPFTYTFTIVNPSTVTAYDITVNDDPLPTYYNAASFTATLNGVTDVSAFFEFDSGNTIFRTVSPASLDLAPGDTLVIVINGTIADNTPVDAVLENTVYLTWTSLDGDFSAPRSSHNTEDSVERDGSGGINDYFAQADSVNAITRPLVLSKSIVSTSEAHTSGTDVAIGEIVRFRLVVEVPEGVNSGFFLEDDLPLGLSFLNDNTATVAFVCDGGANCMESNAAGVGVSPIQSGDETTLPGITPSFVLPDASVSDNRSINTDSYGSGIAVNFIFETLTNRDSDADREYLVVEFNALVDNSITGSNDNGETRDNTFDAWINGSTTAYGAPGGPVTVTIVEPEIVDVAKNLTTAGPYDAGDTLSYTVTFSNSGTLPDPLATTDAFDVVLTDDVSALPFDNLTVISVTPTACANYTAPTDTSTATSLILDFPRISVACSVEVIYEVDLTDALLAGQTVANTAEVTYTSLPGDYGTTSNPTGSALDALPPTVPGPGYTTTPGAENGERNHDTSATGGANNDYSGSDTASLTSRLPSMVKSLFTTELNVAGNDHTQAVIGELLTYELVITVPEGTTPALQVVDTLDSGLAFVDCLSVTPSSADVSTSLAGGFGAACLDGAAGNPAITGSGGVATYNFGTVTNSNTDNLTPDTITIQYTVLPLNRNATPNIQAGSQFNNTAVLSWTGGSQDAVSAPNVTIVEPTLAIAKARTVTGSDAGDTTTFTITVTNGNAASDTVAYDAVVTDIIPAGLTYVAGSAATSGACTAGTPTFSYDVGTRTLSATWGTFAKNTSCILTFNTTIDANVAPGQSIPLNRGRVDWTSISGARQDFSPYNDDSDERTGATGILNGGTLNDYRVQATSPAFNVAQVAAQKELVATSESHTSGANVAIGEIVRYRLALRVPESTITNLQLRDDLPTGLTFLNDDTARFAYLATAATYNLTASNYAAGSVTGATCENIAPVGVVTLADALNTTLLPSASVNCPFPDTNSISFSQTINDDTYATGTDVSFKFGNLVNGDRDDNAEFIVVEFNALVDNSIAGSNDAGETRVNNFRARSGVTLANLGPASNDVTVTVREPEIPFNGMANNKTASPTTGIDAGDTVDFQIVFTNLNTAIPANTTDAFDVVLTDDLVLAGLPFNNLRNVLVSYSGASCPAAGSESTVVTAGTQLVVTFPQIGASCQVTVTYQTTATGAILPGNDYINTAFIRYTSLPGANGTTTNDTGSSTPGTPGAINGERTHDTSATGGANNDYSGSDTAQITSASLIPEKAIIATSEAHTAETLPGAADLAIGEIITYRLTVSVPEGTSNAFVISDVLPAGLGYIPGSARIYTNSALTMTFADLAGVPNTSPGLVIPTDGDGALPAAPGTLFFDSPTRELQINVGDILNQDNDPDAEDIIIELQALVLNTGINNQGTALENQFEVSVNADTPVASNTVSSTVLEPNISNLAKSVTSAGPLYDAGDTVAYRLTYSNTGATDAFDVRVLDTLDSTYFTLNLASVTVNLTDAQCVAGFTDNSLGNNLDVTITQVPVGCDVVIDYTATLETAVEPDQTYPNRVDLTYTSLPGDNGTGDVTPGTPGASDGERNHDTGATGGVNNDYSGSDTADIDTGSVVIVKSIIDTSEAHTGDATADTLADPRPVAIGELLTYRLAVQLFEGTNPSLVITDTLPTGLALQGNPRLTYVSDVDVTNANVAAQTDLSGANTASLTLTAPDYYTYDTGTRLLTINLASPINNDNDAGAEYAYLEFEALVLNDSANQDGTDFANSASLSLSGSTVDTSDSVYAEAVEPLLIISKAGLPASDWRYGDTVAYTIDIEHHATNSTANAFNLEIVDTIPATLTYVTGSASPAAVYNAGARTLTWTISSLAWGDTASLTYDVTVNDYTDPFYLEDNDTAVNTARLTWTSLPGEKGTGAVTPGDSGDPDGERNGTETPAENDYTTSDPHSGQLIQYFALGNRVWYDSNNNARIDDDGPGGDPDEVGIDGVTVELYLADVFGVPTASTGRTATTADGGYYLFDYLEPGNYIVVVTADNFSGILQGYKSSETVMLSTGDVDEPTAPDPNLGPDGVVGGTDDDRDSDDNGTRVNVAGVLPVGAVASRAVTLGPAADEPELEPDLQTGVGQGAQPDNRANMTVDFGFYKTEIGNLIFEDLDADGMYDSGIDTPLSGAIVRLYDSTGTNEILVGDDGILGTADDLLGGVVTTNASGIYAFSGLPEGDYIVRVTAPAGMISTRDDAEQADNDDPDEHEDNNDNGVGTTYANPTPVSSAQLTMDAGEFGFNATATTTDNTLDFGFVYPYAIGNRLWFDTDNDGTINGAEVGVPDGVTVQLWTAVGGVPDSLVTSTTTVTDTVNSRSGYYLFDDLLPGDYIVVIPASNFSDGGLLKGYHSSNVTLQSDGSFADVDMTSGANDDEPNDDNGMLQPNGDVRSLVFTLGLNGLTEPSGEGDLNNGSQGNQPDGRANMTVDFGFYQVEIGDLVFVDVDRDGFYTSGTDSVMAGALVQLFTATGSEIVTGADGIPGTADDGWGPDGISGTADDGDGGLYTDVNGLYRFSGLPEGDYLLRVTPDGSDYTSTYDTAGSADPDSNVNDDDNGIGIATGQVSSGILTMNPGEFGDSTSGLTTDLTVDFGFLPFTYSLGNRVWNDLDNSGTINGSEAGIANVSINLYLDDGDGIYEPGTDDILVAIEVTDANGYYLFETFNQTTNTPMTPGDYWVVVDPSSFGSGAPLENYFSSNPTGTRPDDGLTPNDGVDSNDNGVYVSGDPARPATADPATGGVIASTGGAIPVPVTISTGAEPTDGDESDYVTGAAATSRGTLGQLDNNSDLTVDFGFYKPMSIGNRVWNDVDNSGTINAADGLTPGIPNVLVELYQDTDNSGTLNAGDLLLRSDTTDANGYYLFDNLTPGTYFVVVADDNFAAGQPLDEFFSSDDETGDNGVDNNDNGFNTPVAGYGIASARITLTRDGEVQTESDFSNNPADGAAFIGTNGETNNNSDISIDFGFLQKVAIGNLVWYDLNANGIFESGESGIENVTVQLYSTGPDGLIGGGDDFWVADTVTNASGHYLFDNLIAGNYYLRIPAEEFQPYDAATNPDGGQLYNLLSSPGQGGDDANDQDADENGADTLTPEVDGITSNVFNLQPDAESTADLGDTPVEGYTGLLDDDNIDFTADFAFTELVAIGNRVWYDTGAGVAYNNGIFEIATESGVENVTVELYRPGYGPDGIPGTADDSLPVRTTTTDADGLYIFDRLYPGNYYVLIPASNFATVSDPLYGYVSSLDSAPATTSQIADENVDENGIDANPLVAGIRSQTYNLVPGSLPTGENQAGYTGALDDANTNLTADFGFTRLVGIGNLVWEDSNNNGRVDGLESGIPGITVQLYDALGNEVLVGPDGILGTADDALGGMVTDANGRYYFDNLNPGQYYVQIPASMFDTTAPSPLAGYYSSPGNGPAGDNSDDTLDENGIDPANWADLATAGIRTPLYTLAPGSEPTTDDQTGYTGYLPNSHLNATADFGFLQKVAIGNLIWLDNGAGGGTAGDGRRTAGEPGIPNVIVELYTSAGVKVNVGPDGILGTADDLAGDLQTDANGNYFFDNLLPGEYYVFLPKENFLSGGALENLLSSLGQGTDDTNDEDADENGDDETAPWLNGITGTTYDLQPNDEPTGEFQNGYTGALDDDNVNATSDFAFLFSPQVDLSVTKTDGTLTYAPGEELIYTIMIANAGPNDAPNSVVTDNIPAGITAWTWVCSASTGGASGCDGTASNSANFSDTVNLPAGSSITYTVAAQTDSARTTNLTNTVRIDPDVDYTDIDPGNNEAEDTDTPEIEVDLSISKDNSVATYVPGGTLNYTIVVSNAGPSNAVDATVSDTFPAAITSASWTCSGTAGTTCTAGPVTGNISDTVTIPAGGSITYSVTAQIASSATGDLTNAASVSHPEDTDSLNNDDDHTDTADVQLNLSISKDNSVATYVPGGTLNYTIVVSNAGPSNAVDATVSDTFPAAITSASWTCSGTAGTTCTAGPVTGNISDMVTIPAGGSITYSVTAQIASSATGDLTNTVSVSHPEDTDLTNNEDSHTDTADVQVNLSITKDNSVTNYIPGGTLNYTIVVSNAGPSNAVDATVSDTFPAAITSASWTCSGTAGTSCTAGPVTGDISDTVTIPAGGSITYSVTAQIASSATGDLTNTASVSHPEDTDPLNNDDDHTDTADPQVDLAVTKVALPVGYYLPGGTLTYTIVVTNNGPADVTGAVVTDNIPAQIVSWTWTCTHNGGASGCDGITGSTTNFTDTVNLPLNASIEYTVTATIRDDATGPVNNSVTVTAPTGVSETNTNNNEDDVTNLPASLTVTKDDGLTVVAPGSIITYEIIVTNDGSVDLTDITVTDTLPADVTFQSATPAPATAPDGSTPGGIVTWTGISLLVGESDTLTVTVQVNAEPGVSFTNTVVAEDGNTGQRDEDDDTNQTAVQTGKALTDTNEPTSVTPNVAIGEILTYQISLDVPAGATMTNLQALDVLDYGLAFVRCVRIEGGVLETNYGQADPATFVANFDSVCDVPLSPSTPPNPTVAAEPLANLDPEHQGRRVTFDFGDVRNPGVLDVRLVVTYEVVVLNILANQDGLGGLNNSAAWTWDGGSLEASADPVEIIEPDMDIDKTASPTVAPYGATINFTFDIYHTPESTADAFDVIATDILPPGLAFVPGSVSVTGLPPTEIIYDEPRTTLYFVWDHFPLGETSLITFQTVFVGPAPVVNSVDLAWTSLPIDPGLDGNPIEQSEYNEYSTERWYDPPDDAGINTYGSTSSVSITVPSLLPATGFAPGVVSALPAQPVEKAYNAMNGIWIEIPDLGVRLPMLDVPISKDGWDLTWLSNQAGYLAGTTRPGDVGTMGVTAHVSLADGNPGPFQNLRKLFWGNKVIMYAHGYRYTYEVRENRLVLPRDMSVLRQDGYAWMTLITCEGYSPLLDSYSYRVAVRAVLLSVEPDNTPYPFASQPRPAPSSPAPQYRGGDR